MTIKGIKRRIFFYILNKWLVGTNPRLFKFKRKLLIWSGIKIGKGSKVVGPIRITGELEIGENTWIGSGFTIHGNGKVFIGKNCDIAPDVTFSTGSHEIGDNNRRAGSGYNKDIIIEDAVWICTGTTILGGVKIQKASIIASKALVNKDVSSNTLVGGVPAIFIKDLK
ncbi:hypothetical protein ACRS99_002907 [Clostridium perfringens]|nr:acyltransferase [Clostridium perfringens]EJT6162611.1 acyltransferase [Clostridium perfringens]